MPISSVTNAVELASKCDFARHNFDVPVYFVAKEIRRRWPELDGPESWMNLADVPPSRLHLLENIWIVSTYLRLRAKGLGVKIVDQLVPNAVNICTSDRLLYDNGSERSFIVAVQADRGRLGWGEYTLAQSPAQVNRPDVCLIDHWPQPGLIPRDTARGSQISKVGYVGYPANLAPAFHKKAFHDALRALDVEWVLRGDPSNWNDYSDLDLSIAVRGSSNAWAMTKPATKLVHAWLTGCPALLGNEPAFRYWGLDGEDYFETNTPDQVLAVVKRLRQSPEFYCQVQERGWQKSKLHDEEAVCRQWMAIISGPVTNAFLQWQQRNSLRRLRRQTQRTLSRFHKVAFYLRAKAFENIRGKFCARVPSSHH